MVPVMTKRIQFLFHGKAYVIGESEIPAEVRNDPALSPTLRAALADWEKQAASTSVSAPTVAGTDLTPVPNVEPRGVSEVTDEPEFEVTTNARQVASPIERAAAGTAEASARPAALPAKKRAAAKKTPRTAPRGSQPSK